LGNDAVTLFLALPLLVAALILAQRGGLKAQLVWLGMNRVSRDFPQSLKVRWIGGYFLFVALGLSLVYLAQSIGFILTGQLPSIVTISEHPTSVVFALDFTLLIPWLVIGAIWLIKRQPWGYVVAGSINVKGPLYTLVLSVNSILVVRAGISTDSQLPLWGTLTVLGLTASALFYLPKPSADLGKQSQ
jgi:hypothetical protein